MNLKWAIPLVFILLLLPIASAIPSVDDDFINDERDFIIWSKVLFPHLSMRFKSLTVTNMTVTGVLRANETHITNTTVIDVNVTRNITVQHTLIATNMTINGSTLFVDSVNERVGIGTTSPNVKLEVVETTSDIVRFSGNTASLIIQNTGTDIALNSNAVNLLISGGDATNSGANIALFGGEHATLPNLFRLRQDGTTVLSVTNGGNVGIGTTTPGEKLEVHGNILLGDNNKSYYGAGKDVSTTFNSSDMVWLAEVGTPNYYFEGFDNVSIIGDAIITGTLSGESPVKIVGINMTDQFTFKENLNSTFVFSIQNINESDNATSFLTALNDVGYSMNIGIGSSTFRTMGSDYSNFTAMLSRSRGKTVFANFYNQSFSWFVNPSDDNDANNLVEIMSVSEIGLNLSNGSIYLGDFQTSASGGAKVVKRSNADGALFGVSNPIAGANPTSGAGYVSIQDCGNYTVDAHSSLDTNNPNTVVHHLRGCMEKEDWRLSSDFANSSFEFESSLNVPILKINKTDVSVTDVNFMAINATINDFMRLVANTSAITCTAGTIYYDGTDNAFYGCNGTWERLM